MPCPARQPTDQPTGRKQAFTYSIQMHKPTRHTLLAFLQKRSSCKIKACSPVPLLVLYAVKQPYGPGRPVIVQVHGAGIW